MGEFCSTERGSHDRAGRGVTLKNRLVVIVGSGSQAASNIPGVSSEFARLSGSKPIVVLTRAAKRFVTKDAIINVGGAAQVFDDASPQLASVPNHILLAQTASLVIVYPTSAGFLGRVANGLASDLASTMIIAAHNVP